MQQQRPKEQGTESQVRPSSGLALPLVKKDQADRKNGHRTKHEHESTHS
jgi:hypothetical protein